MELSSNPQVRLAELRKRWDADRRSRIFLQLAEEYRRQGQQADAIGVLEVGLSHNPSSLAGQVALGRCLMELGRYPDAKEVLEAVLDKDPTQMVAYRHLVDTHLALGDADAAAQRLAIYEQLNPRDEEIPELEQRLRQLRAVPLPAEPPSEEASERAGSADFSADPEATGEDPPAFVATLDPSESPFASQPTGSPIAAASSEPEPVEEPSASAEAPSTAITAPEGFDLEGEDPGHDSAAASTPSWTESPAEVDARPLEPTVGRDDSSFEGTGGSAGTAGPAEDGIDPDPPPAQPPLHGQESNPSLDVFALAPIEIPDLHRLGEWTTRPLSALADPVANGPAPTGSAERPGPQPVSDPLDVGPKAEPQPARWWSSEELISLARREGLIRDEKPPLLRRRYGVVKAYLIALQKARSAQRA